MDDKSYVITFSDELANKIGHTTVIGIGKNPPDTIKKTLLMFGYKVSLSRLHSYSRDTNPADIMTSLDVTNFKGTYIYDAFYRIKIMIKIK